MVLNDSWANMPVHQNPILPGFNPDPSLVRVGEDYYLTTSTVRYSTLNTLRFLRL